MTDPQAPVLVIGATGQQGGATARQLLERDQLTDLSALRAEHPGLMRLETWLRAAEWKP